MNSQPSYGGVRNSNEEKRVLDKSRSLLNWLTERNFDKIKDEIVQTIIRASPSAFAIKSLVCFIFDMAMVDSTANVLFARLSVHLFNSLPTFPSAVSHGETTTFERLFLCKCRMELEHSSPDETRRHAPLVYVDESDSWRFIKTVRLLAEIFKNRMLSQSTRKCIIQVLMNPIFPPERNTDAMNIFLSSVGVLADFQFCDENFKQLVQNSRAVELERSYKEQATLREEELDTMKRLLESYKEDKLKLDLHSQGLEQKYQDESNLRKETERTLAIEREISAKVRLRLETLEDEHNNLLLKAEELERNYTDELILRKESETALGKERNELEALTQVFEFCKREQDNLTSQEKYEQELSLRKETEDALTRQKEELEIVKGLLESYNQEADAMRGERDRALQTVQELTRKHLEERQPPPSFFCPITQEVMKDPHFAADGFTYEAESIKQWFSRGRDTSPMTNLKLPHRNLVPNRALKSAIQDLS
ncbi:putative U-box domain-containing protein 58 [Hirschfeldia incana]|nr:putative U-box domain-containing protein 58 [Hirschfeldia incana]